MSTKQDKPPETGPYGSILLECPCVWGEVGADGTGRVLGYLVNGFRDDRSYMLGTVEGLLYVVCIRHICLTGGVSSVKGIDELGGVGAKIREEVERC